MPAPQSKFGYLGRPLVRVACGFGAEAKTLRQTREPRWWGTDVFAFAAAEHWTDFDISCCDVTGPDELFSTNPLGQLLSMILP